MRYQQPCGISDPDASYINGNPAAGLAGSIPPGEAFEHTMREIVNMISKSGFEPSENDLYQLGKAIRSQFINYVLDTGTTNNLAGVFDPPLVAYTPGLTIRCKVAHRCTGPSQGDFGPGWAEIVRPDGTPTIDGDMVPGGVAELIYHDAVLQLQNPAIGGSVSGGVSGGTSYQTNYYGSGFEDMIAWAAAGSYTWDVPLGVRKVWGRFWAGGGAASPCAAFSNTWHSGGNGGYVEGLWDVVPGTTMRIIIGAGVVQAIASHDVAPPSGGNTTFGIDGGATLATATGGESATGVSGTTGRPPGQGRDGTGTGGAIGRANGIYGKGGGAHGLPSADQVTWDPAVLRGQDGAGILMW